MAQVAQASIPARKILFCQIQYYVFDGAIPPENLNAVKYAKILCPSEVSKGFLSRVFHLAAIDIVPNHVDPAIFFRARQENADRADAA